MTCVCVYLSGIFGKEIKRENRGSLEQYAEKGEEWSGVARPCVVHFDACRRVSIETYIAMSLDGWHAFCLYRYRERRKGWYTRPDRWWMCTFMATYLHRKLWSRSRKGCLTCLHHWWMCVAMAAHLHRKLWPKSKRRQVRLLLERKSFLSSKKFSFLPTQPLCARLGSCCPLKLLPICAVFRSKSSCGSLSCNFVWNPALNPCNFRFGILLWIGRRQDVSWLFVCCLWLRCFIIWSSRCV